MPDCGACCVAFYLFETTASWDFSNLAFHTRSAAASENVPRGTFEFKSIWSQAKISHRQRKRSECSKLNWHLASVRLRCSTWNISVCPQPDLRWRARLLRWSKAADQQHPASRAWDRDRRAPIHIFHNL